MAALSSDEELGNDMGPVRESRRRLSAYALAFGLGVSTAIQIANGVFVGFVLRPLWISDNLGDAYDQLARSGARIPVIASSELFVAAVFVAFAILLMFVASAFRTVTSRWTEATSDAGYVLLHFGLTGIITYLPGGILSLAIDRVVTLSEDQVRTLELIGSVHNTVTFSAIGLGLMLLVGSLVGGLLVSRARKHKQ